MNERRLIGAAVAIAALTLASGACKRQTASPELQTTTGAQPRMEATTVSGCLKSGLAEDTFVLEESKAAGESATATYRLTAPDTVNLKQYVGQYVEVKGTVRSEQEVATSGGVEPEKRAKGAPGNPTVETKTDLDIKQMTVTAATPTGARCDK